MAQTESQPWNPEHSWADPFIAALVLAILLLAGGQSWLRRTRPHGTENGLTLQGRIQDVVLGAARAASFAPLKNLKLPGTSISELAEGHRSAWDQALLAVHAAEAGDLDTGGRLIGAAPGADGAAFRQAWQWSYRGAGTPPTAEAFRAVQRALGGGCAARILEARLLAKSGGDPGPLVAQAQAWATARLVAFGSASSAGVLLAMAGLGFALYLFLMPGRPVSLPHFGLSGRAVVIVMLAWFLALLAAGPLVTALVSVLPGLRPLFLPLVYGFHALLGLGFLCRAEGVDLPTLWRRVAPGRHRTALAMGLGFFALAFGAVVAVSLVLSPLLHNAEPPQKDLLELLGHMRGFWTVTLLFLTVAVAAPVFEEILFRGFLLPWLGERMEARLGARRGRLLAVAVTGLGFGAMHMQPLGLPTLTTLGIVLGFAFVRTGDLTTSILVHGLWNGGIFIIMRTMV
jgi:membrane protease YdiL (CAAX protease family)